MAQVTNLDKRTIEDYARFIDEPQQLELAQLAHSLKGKKIIEINATSYGGGVAELLRGKIALLQGMGVSAEWHVLPPNEAFFHTTKTLHNCLQGHSDLPDKTLLKQYSDYLAEAARDIPRDGDIYVLHDPQTLGLAAYLPPGRLIWRCHIDLTEANPGGLNWLKGYYKYFSKVIFSLENYAHGLGHDKVAIVHPSIDPLSDKNKPLSPEQVARQLSQFQLDERYPYILQVSRFDRFKDPLGVVDIYRDLVAFMPQYRLLMVGNMASDDPEGREYYDKVSRKVALVDEHIQLITEADDTSINALQSGAGAIIQNSHREGFGLTVTEALWKKQFVFSRPVGGIALQVVDGRTGFYLEENAFESAEKMVNVLRRPDDYLQIRMQARELVRRKFLLPTMTAGYMRTYLKIG
jgi:trehalose synthase